MLRKAYLPQPGVVKSLVPDKTNNMPEVWNTRGYKRRFLGFLLDLMHVIGKEEAKDTNKQ